MQEYQMTTSPDDSVARIDKLRDDYRLLMQKLEANERDFRRLGRSVLRVQEDERRRLARELHDGLGQNLTALKHQLAMLAADLQAGGRGDLASRAEACVGLCARTLAETRQLSRLLRPQVLDDLGLADALRWLGRTLGESAGLDVQVEVGELPVLDGELQTLLFRVAQEALSNVLKHAGAAQAVVALTGRSGWISLTVWDDGPGFDAAAALRVGSDGQHAGLAGLRERLALYGGRLSLDSAPERGSRLQAQLPVPEEAGTLPS
jgi:signal transduction histidine kinase